MKKDVLAEINKICHQAIEEMGKGTDLQEMVFVATSTFSAITGMCRGAVLMAKKRKHRDCNIEESEEEEILEIEEVGK